MTIIGVDLGAKGGWVAFPPSHDGPHMYKAGKPDPKAIRKYSAIHVYRDPKIFVEKPLKNRKGTNIAALTSMQREYGYFCGYMDASYMPYTPVEYHEWARVMLGGGKYPASVRCRELWPDNPWIAGHEGLADAALIAEYGRMLIQTKQS